MYLTRYSLSLTERAGASFLAVAIPASVAFALMLSWPKEPQGTETGEVLTLINLSGHSENSRRQNMDDNSEKPRVDERHRPNQKKVAAVAAAPKPVIPKRILVGSDAGATEQQLEMADISSSYSETGSESVDSAASAHSSSAGPTSEPATGGPAENGKPVPDSYGQLAFVRIKAAQKYERVLARDSIAGTVTVAFNITRRGSLRAARVAVSSGNILLDRVAMRHLAAAAPFPRPPNGRERSFVIPLTYRNSE